MKAPALVAKLAWSLAWSLTKMIHSNTKDIGFMSPFSIYE